MRTIYRSNLSFLAVSMFLFTMVGCGSSAPGNVSGEVKYNGQPLPDGNITFISQVGDKQTVRGKITDGRYSLPGVPVGPVEITVQTIAPSTSTLPPGVKPITPPAGEPQPAPPTGKYVPIPQKYGVPEQSGLKYTVVRGDQTHNIELTR